MLVKGGTDVEYLERLTYVLVVVIKQPLPNPIGVLWDTGQGRRGYCMSLPAFATTLGRRRISPSIIAYKILSFVLKRFTVHQLN